MSTFDQRILYGNNGTLSDLSISLNDYTTGTETVAAFVAAEDYIYVGAPLPFNQKYFDVSTVNTAATVASVSIWNGSAWVATTDVIDRTNVSGKSLAQSGYISFRPDIDNSSWVKESRSADVTGLTGTDIYHMYWARFAWSANWSASVIIDYIGHRFSTDLELYGQYPSLNSSTLRGAYKTSSTTWDEPAFVASDYIISDLMERNLILSAGQVLDATKLRLASIHKTAEIIYRGIGTAYAAHATDAAVSYGRAINLKNLYIDLNQNAELDSRERTQSTVVLHR